MPDWSIEPRFYDEPTFVPTGNECEHAARNENCRHTDCPECGREASAQLRAEAMLNNDGVLALAREVVRIEEGYSARSLPEYAVAVGDLARCRFNAGHERKTPALAWAEGVVQAIIGDTELRPTDYHGRLDEQAAFRAGVELVISAAGPQGQPEPTTHEGGQAGHRSGPGFESRAQHSASSDH